MGPPVWWHGRFYTGGKGLVDLEAYTTIAGVASATLVEKKSEFIATASFADTEQAALDFLGSVRAAHRSASHNVYAYLLRQGARTRYSDDGEPQKTAGLPVLEVLRHSGLTDLVLVVTRYFGGTLLGTGGLVRAYTGAAQAALEKAERVTVRPCVRLRVELAYPLYEQAMRLAGAAGAKVEETAFTDKVTLCLLLLAGAEGPLLGQLKELCHGRLQAEQSPPFYTPF